MPDTTNPRLGGKPKRGNELDLGMVTSKTEALNLTQDTDRVFE